MTQSDGSAVVQFFNLLNMFTVARCSEKTSLFKHLANHIFFSLQFENYINDVAHIFFWKCSIFDVDFRYAPKNWEIFSCFLDNCTWTECGKFFLLRGEKVSSAVSMITNTPRISNTLRPTFSKSTFANGMKQYDGRSAAEVFRHYNMLTVRRCSKTKLFRHLTNHISGSLYFQKIHIILVSSFFWKCSKFSVDFRYIVKKGEKFYFS